MQSDLNNNTVNFRKAQKVVSISTIKKNKLRKTKKTHSCCDENFSLLIRQIELSKKKKKNYRLSQAHLICNNLFTKNYQHFKNYNGIWIWLANLRSRICSQPTFICDWPRVFPVIRSWIPPRAPPPLPTPPLRTKLTARNTNLIG